jgi:hypothetical protein
MTTVAPQRIQLRRSKGWRMPANTVKVDRTTPWGNPFVVGKDGTRAECVRWFELLMAGYLMLSADCNAQDALRKRLLAEKKHGFPSLRGKNLACWCPSGAPCHADILLKVVNEATP